MNNSNSQITTMHVHVGDKLHHVIMPLGYISRPKQKVIKKPPVKLHVERVKTEGHNQ